MKIVNISDIHSKYKQIKNLPNGDVIIVSGDITSVGYIHEVKYFLNWFNKLNYKYKIFIAGNHDFLFEEQSSLAKEMINITDVIYLEDSEIIIDGIKFYGTPVSKPFYDWAFNRDDERRELHFLNIPHDVDVLITHTPPFSILDMTKNNGNQGCPILLKQFESGRIKPLINVFGHIHEGYGTHKKYDTLFINASILNDKYYLVNKPIVVEIDDNKNVNVIEY